jgi:hypothetical protein
MNPLFFILFFVAWSTIYCSECDTLPRREISSLDEYAGIQSSSNNPPRAENSSIDVILQPQNDPNNLVSLFALVSQRGSDSSSSSDDEMDAFDIKFDNLLNSGDNQKNIINKDGSLRKRNRVDYKRSAKKLKAGRYV